MPYDINNQNEEEIFIDLDEAEAEVDDEQWPDGFNADHSLYYES